ncbi:TetR/AcrR family transcriptional regulator [Pseudonocardia ailaonensis]|uniref:TetR/AcrR family transcriptional regulator n=1 Tax=Pseudonocardia ailaonensis TaxID=367279 RepID=A0ABN2NIU2_9PSEU
MGFQRARSPEQREERRRSILDTAAAMLREMPVAELSLNELSRRVGLAKSNVLRYFDSREAVLLELLTAEWAAWRVDAGAALAAGPRGAVEERCEQVAAVLAESLHARPVLCDLAGAQASVLERNVSAEVAARFKRTVVVEVMEFAGLVRGCIPELSEQSAFEFAGAATISAGALWGHCRPSAAMLEAYAADPELAAMRLDFVTTLQGLLAVLLRGFLVRG